MDKQAILNSIDDIERRKAKFQPVFAALHDIYGEITWRQDQGAMDELVSCILSQNTNDTNRDRAFFALKERYPTWQAVVDAPVDELIDTIRPAGLANQKGPRIQHVLELIKAEHGNYNIDFLRDMPLDEARNWLTSMQGIGPKTAAIVLCFAFGLPAFPVDTHVLRVSKRIGFLPPNTSADKAHPIMESIIPPEYHYAFHILLIQHGRDTCTARRAYCERCPLTTYCDYFQEIVQNHRTEHDQ